MCIFRLTLPKPLRQVLLEPQRALRSGVTDAPHTLGSAVLRASPAGSPDPENDFPQGSVSTVPSTKPGTQQAPHKCLTMAEF